MSRVPRRSLAHSIQDASRGLCHLLRSKGNARIHLASTAAAIGLGVWVKLSAAEWCWITAAIAAVWVAEGFNTALEVLADALHPERDPGVGRAKDIAAGAVFLAALAALVIGGLVLGPRLLRLAP